ncbi:MAG: sialidase, partial [Polymorphobacter sp.]
DGAVITYYQKSRHVFGRMKLEIIDANGKVVDTLPTSKRKGLNRVVWAMRTKPPQTPPAASLAFASTQGQRVMPGTYTVRLTKGDKVTEMPLVVALDKRAQYTVADRQAQYDAAERVKALFARMTALTAGLNALKAQSLEVAENPATSPANKARALDVAAKADVLRKQVVATTEGGAITGEERLRENMDMAYGAITSTDARPTNYAIARVDALEKELAEVEAGYAALKAEQATALNKALSVDGVSPIDLAAVMPRPDEARGGPAAAIGNFMIGTRYQGSMKALSTGKKR